MSIFIILGIAFLISAVGTFLTDEWSGFHLFFVVILVAAIVTASILGFVCVMRNINAEADLARGEARYEVLYAQVVNNVYDNDNDIGKRGLMKDIQNWNEWLSSYEKHKANKWIKIFFPIDVSGLKPIPVNLIK